MRLVDERKETIEEIKSLIINAEETVDIIVVEGRRDEESLRSFGYHGKVEVYSHIRKSEHDKACLIAEKGSKILILTDFDLKGNRIAYRLTKLLESERVFVDKETRHTIGKLVAFLGLRTIEELDDITIKNKISVNSCFSSEF